MLGNLAIFLSSDDYVQNEPFQTILSDIPQECQNSLGPDFGGPDLGPNCLQKSTAYGPRLEKTCLRGFANNTGADQPAHLRSLISAFVNSLFGKYII